MIFCYNKVAVGDTLLVVVANQLSKDIASESCGTVTRVFEKETNRTLGWNFFKASTFLKELEGQGQIQLKDTEIELLNKLLNKEGFADQLINDTELKIVTGFVQTCKKHPDSDHLSITETEVDSGTLLQIVCGAANIKAGLKVVVAKPGAMMPDGLIIAPGKLRGIDSFGMICSAKELRLPQAINKPGILELPFDSEIGIPFEFISHNL